MKLALRSQLTPLREAHLRHIHIPVIARRVVLWSSLLAIAAVWGASPGFTQPSPAQRPAQAQPPAPPSSGANAPPAGPVGVWIDDTGRGAVEIKPCGTNLCGLIYWLQEPISQKTGRAVTDANNPDAAKRNRAVCGLQVIGGARAQGDGSWDEGWIYDPKVGKSYDVMFSLEKRDRLTVTGYKGVKFLSKTFVWTRAPADLPRCDVSAAERPANPGRVANPSAAAGAAPRPLPPARAATTPLPLPTQR